MLYLVVFTILSIALGQQPGTNQCVVGIHRSYDSVTGAATCGLDDCHGTIVDVADWEAECANIQTLLESVCPDLVNCGTGCADYLFPTEQTQVYNGQTHTFTPCDCPKCNDPTRTTVDPCPDDCETDSDCCTDPAIPCDLQCVDPSTLHLSGSGGNLWYSPCNVCYDTSLLPTTTEDPCPGGCQDRSDCWDRSTYVSGTTYTPMECKNVDNSTGCGECVEMCSDAGQCMLNRDGGCDLGQMCAPDDTALNSHCGVCIDVDTAVNATEPADPCPGGCQQRGDCYDDTWQQGQTPMECRNIDDVTGCGECAEPCSETGECMLNSPDACGAGQVCEADFESVTALYYYCGVCVDANTVTADPMTTVGACPGGCQDRSDCWDQSNYVSGSSWTPMECKNINDTTGCGECAEMCSDEGQCMLNRDGGCDAGQECVTDDTALNSHCGVCVDVDPTATECGECVTSRDCNDFGTGGTYHNDLNTHTYSTCEPDADGCGQCVDHSYERTTEAAADGTDATEDAVGATDADMGATEDVETTDDEGPGRGPQARSDSNRYGIMVGIGCVIAMCSWM